MKVIFNAPRGLKNIPAPKKHFETQKSNTSDNTEYEVRKICTNIFQGMQIFLSPNFCPFLLLKYIKEADKNIS